MKLKMEYEPSDFMRLVRKDLEGKGIPVPADSAITFKATKKGQPTVEVTIEVDDEPVVAAPPAPPVTLVPRSPSTEENEDDEAPSMEKIMRESDKLVGGIGKIKRPLMPNESTEFPKD